MLLEQLQGHNLEREGRAMEQFLRPQPGFELHQRRHRRMAEAGVGVAAELRSVANGIVVPT